VKHLSYKKYVAIIGELTTKSKRNKRENPTDVAAHFVSFITKKAPAGRAADACADSSVLVYL
jgi:hypothetical protein